VLVKSYKPMLTSLNLPVAVHVYFRVSSVVSQAPPSLLWTGFYTLIQPSISIAMALGLLPTRVSGTVNMNHAVVAAHTKAGTPSMSSISLARPPSLMVFNPRGSACLDKDKSPY
jgi:hypothetical protein